MTRNWLRIQRTLRTSALGVALLSLGTLNACFANFIDYQNWATTVGKATIQTISDTTFANAGADFDAIVVTPTTTFVQALWANYVDSRLPDDIPNNPIVKR
jgi:hypothetical protein